LGKGKKKGTVKESQNQGRRGRQTEPAPGGRPKDEKRKKKGVWLTRGPAGNNKEEGRGKRNSKGIEQEHGQKGGKGKGGTVFTLNQGEHEEIIR